MVPPFASGPASPHFQFTVLCHLRFSATLPMRQKTEAFVPLRHIFLSLRILCHLGFSATLPFRQKTAAFVSQCHIPPTKIISEHLPFGL